MALRPPTYTPTPNEFFDELLPILKCGEMKVLLVIYRQTFGWRKEWDQISISQLMKKTGLSEPTVLEAINSLLEKNLIEKEIEGVLGTEKVFYRVVMDEEKEVGGPPKNSGPPPLPKILGGPPKNSGIQKTLLQNKEEKQQQQREDAAAVSIWDCLKGIDIPSHDKEEITRTYQEADVRHAIEWSKHPKTKIKSTLAAALKWACKVKPEIPSEEKVHQPDVTDDADKIHARKMYFDKFKKDNWNPKRLCLSCHGTYCMVGNDKFYYDNPRFYEMLKHAEKKHGLV